MALSPATIDLLVVTVLEGIRILGRVASGQEITEEELKLETFEQTRERILSDLRSREK